MLPGYDMICCQTTGNVSRANYGIGMPILTAAILRAQEYFGASVGNLQLAVRIGDLLLVALILLGLRLLNRRHFWWLTAVVLIGLPALALNSDTRPNLVGLRYVPFMVGTVVLIVLSRRTAKPIDVLTAALTSGLAVAISPETGIALALGFVAFLIITWYRPCSPLASLTKILMAFTVLTGASLLGGMLLARIVVKGSASSGSFDSVSNFITGFGGYSVGWDPVLAIVVLGAALAIVRATYRARGGLASAMDAYQCGIGVTMLAWLIYYVNRQTDTNIWFEFVLLVLLWAQPVERLGLRVLSWPIGSVAPYSWIAVALIGGLLLSGIGGTVRALGAIPNEPRNCDPPYALIESRCLASPDAMTVKSHLEFLAGLSNKGDFLVLTHLPTAVRILGFNESFPWYEPFGEVLRPEDLDTLVSYIDQHGPPYLIVEDPKTVQSQQLRNVVEHQSTVLRRLDRYTFDSADEGLVGLPQGGHLMTALAEPSQRGGDPPAAARQDG